MKHHRGNIAKFSSRNFRIISENFLGYVQKPVEKPGGSQGTGSVERAAKMLSVDSSSHLPCKPKPVWPSKTTRSAETGRPGAALGGICRCDTGLEALGRISEGRRIRHAAALVADYRQHVFEQLAAMVGACHRAVRACSATPVESIGRRVARRPCRGSPSPPAAKGRPPLPHWL